MVRDQRRLAAIVSLDVVGYSRLMGRDESATLSALKAHRRELIDPKIAEHDGRIVKTMGDGLLVEFASVVDAVRASVDIQRGMAERNADVPADERIVFRFGINVGDIIIDGDDIHGDGVNVAARLQSIADPGGICASRAVRDQVLDKLDFAFEDLGSREVKNIARPVEVFRVRFGGVVPSAVNLTKPRIRMLAIAAVVVALAAFGWFAAREWVRPASVTAYSAQDRRMTFAVIPLTAPAGDAETAKVAVAWTEVVQEMQEARSLWAVVVPRTAVEQALTRHATTQALAQALNVHFLIRGSVTRTPSGHDLELRVVDASTDRVLRTRSIVMAAGVPTASQRYRIDDALSSLTFNAVREEARRARDKPLDALDVRDLTFRAYADWGDDSKDPKVAHLSATGLLDRALAMAPDDPLALLVTAEINLCDCVQGWSTNVAEQQAVGTAALEKFLNRNPDSIPALGWKHALFAMLGQYEEALVITGMILKREPVNSSALHDQAFSLLRLGRPREALETAARLAELPEDASFHIIHSAIHYKLGNDELAASHAQNALAQLSSEEQRNGNRGTVALTLIAAEARLGRQARARTALAAFRKAVPGVTTIAEIKAWMKPNAELTDYEPLFDGLRRAGVRDG